MNIKKLKRAGVPLVFFETSDPAATIRECTAELNGSAPLAIQFDCVRTMASLNDIGAAWLRSNGPEQGFTFQVADWLQKLATDDCLKGSKGVVYWHNPDWTDRFVRQGFWNIRDAFARNGWMMVCLGASADIPPELRMDFVTMTETLPDMEQVVEIVSKVCQTARAASSSFSADAMQINQASRALLGLNRFAVEQGAALAVSASGISVADCWSHKLGTVKIGAGCEMSINNPKFDSVKGLSYAVNFFKSYIKGKRPPGIVCRWDEVEKQTAGYGTDTSGVSTKLMGIMLTWMEEKKVDAGLLLGVPGAGKSLISRAVAGEAGVIFADLSIANLQSSLVGSSEANLRAALRSIETISQGNILLLSTSNDVSMLPPELLARHKLCKLFFDFPSDEENAAMWKYYMERHGLYENDIPENTRNWVGREIDGACYKSWLLDRPLAEVIRSTVPMCVSAKSKMDALRNGSSGRFESASYEGAYDINKTTTATSGRMIG